MCQTKTDCIAPKVHIVLLSSSKRKGKRHLKALLRPATKSNNTLVYSYYRLSTQQQQRQDQLRKTRRQLIPMEHRAVMRRSLSLQRLSAGYDDNHRCHNSTNSSSNNKMSDMGGKGSLSLSFSSGWFGKGKPNNESSNKNEEYLFGYKPKQTSTTRTSSPQQQKLRVQEIAQNRSIKQDFLSRMRESGVVTSAGYQAVLQDFVSSQGKEGQVIVNETAACIASIQVDPRAEMGSSQKSSSQRSSLRSSSSARLGSSRRFPSFFTASSFHDDEDFVPSRNPSDSTAMSDNMRDGGAEVINRRRRSCRRRGSSRRFGSFFASAGNDFSENDNKEANIAPLRRSVQLTQEQIEQLENAADELDINLDRWESKSFLSNANSSLSDSLQENVNSSKKDKGTNMRRGSNASLDLDEIFFDAIDKCILQTESNSATPNESLLNTSQGSSNDSSETRSNRDSPIHSKKCTGEESFSNEQENEESCDFGSSESSCMSNKCGWLPWPARRGSIDDKRNESYATLQALRDDNSFLPWPEHRTPKNNGRALAA